MMPLIFRTMADLELYLEFLDLLGAEGLHA